MKDILFQVDELHEAGLSVEEIARRLNLDVPVIISMFEWLARYPSRQRDDDGEV
jgi:orotate phosphoribosyltransferase-like protein